MNSSKKQSLKSEENNKKIIHVLNTEYLYILHSCGLYNIKFPRMHFVKYVKIRVQKSKICSFVNLFMLHPVSSTGSSLLHSASHWRAKREISRSLLSAPGTNIHHCTSPSAPPWVLSPLPSRSAKWSMVR